LNRGQIWLVEFPTIEEVVGREQAGTRPALVLSTHEFNDNRSGLVVVIPITKAMRSISSHVPIKRPEAGVPEDCFIMCEQVKSVSKDRLINQFGTVSSTTMKKVGEIVGNILGIVE
jgi:mRNA interferase MazF